jgi:hypothetical protein
MAFSKDNAKIIQPLNGYSQVLITRKPGDNMNPVLPLYECHKKVRAAKITDVRYQDPEQSVLTLDPGDGSKIEIWVRNGFIAKHNPQAGGYYVMYEDGYVSYSPAKAFEEGYSLSV